MNYNEIRGKTRKIKVGNTFVGGDAPVSVQSMTNTPTEDFESTYAQIKRLEAAGCDIVRVTVPSLAAVESVYRLKCSDIAIPIVADIHFDYKLALECAQAGIDKIRINPGNIGSPERIKAVADACRARGIPIRIGVNSGSVQKDLLAKYGGPAAAALAESALENARLLERFDFNDIIIAIKSSDVARMIEANERVASVCEYPLHLGVTEAGPEGSGTVKSAIGIGSLLTRGIGDTIRVSLTADPVTEVIKGRQILDALGMDSSSLVTLVSCPTCGRTKIDIIGIAKRFEEVMPSLRPSRRIKAAIMGCAVNGPGEAADADIGIAGGDREALLFRKGKIVGKIAENEIISTLIKEINSL